MTTLRSLNAVPVSEAKTKSPIVRVGRAKPVLTKLRVERADHRPDRPLPGLGLRLDSLALSVHLIADMEGSVLEVDVGPGQAKHSRSAFRARSSLRAAQTSLRARGSASASSPPSDARHAQGRARGSQGCSPAAQRGKANGRAARGCLGSSTRHSPCVRGPRSGGQPGQS